MWKLDTPPINITLNKSTAAITEPTLKIVELKDVSEEMKGHLIRVK